MAGTRIFLRTCALSGLAVILAACAAPGRSATADIAAAGPAAGVADGGAGILLTPGGTAWTSASDTILRSTDDGISWRVVLPAKTTCGCFGPAYFLGPNNAWDVKERSIPRSLGFTARVWFTANGGHTWTIGGSLPGEPALQDADPFKQIDFADARHGWILGYGQQIGAPVLQVVLWRTSDGGRSWRRVDRTGLPEAGRGVSDRGNRDSCGSQDSLGLTFTGAAAGWLTGDTCGGRTPEAWSTHDGGESWRQVTVPPPPGGWPADGTADAEAPVFSTPGNGLLPVSTGPGRLLIYRTQDAGQHWTLASSVATGSLERPAGLIAMSPARWLLPVTDGLLSTDNAGRQWHLTGSGTDLQGLLPWSMLPGGTGLAAGGEPGGAGTYPFAAYRTASAGRSWSPVGRSPDSSGGKASLVYGITTTGRARGLAYGLAGIQATSDGGRRWTPVARSVGAISSLAFGDHRHGIAVAQGSLLITSDGGRHWDPGGEPAAGRLTWVQAVSGSVAVGGVCGEQDASAFERSTDGGRSWHQVTLPGAQAASVTAGACGAAPGTAVCFATLRAGFYVAPGKHRARLQRTADGGRTWAVVAGALPRGTTGLSACGRSTLWAVADAPDSPVNEQEYAVFRSVNGGRSWIKVLAANSAQDMQPAGAGRPVSVTRAPEPSLAALGVVSPLTAWLAGSCGGCGGYGQLAIIRSGDGGATWIAPGGGPVTRPDLVPGLSLLSAASFRSATAGWLLGWPAARSGATVLLATADGGASWQRIAVFRGR
jgi:photosystem II stability/assembly factor-like uncharacterized protein